MGSLVSVSISSNRLNLAKRPDGLNKPPCCRSPDQPTSRSESPNHSEISSQGNPKVYLFGKQISHNRRRNASIRPLFSPNADTMNYMNQSSLFNLSGRVIPENAVIAISGEPKPGDVLVIETFDGTHGTANWRTDAEMNTRRGAREKVSSKPGVPPQRPPALKERAPYT